MRTRSKAFIGVLVVVAFAGCARRQPAPSLAVPSLTIPLGQRAHSGLLDLGLLNPTASIELKVRYNGVPIGDGRTSTVVLGRGDGAQRTVIAQSPTQPIGGSTAASANGWFKGESIPAGALVTDLGVRIRVEWTTMLLWHHASDCEVRLPIFTPKPDAVYLCDVTYRRLLSEGCTATLYEKSPTNGSDFVASGYSRSFRLTPVVTASAGWDGSALPDIPHAGQHHSSDAVPLGKRDPDCAYSNDGVLVYCHKRAR